MRLDRDEDLVAVDPAFSKLSGRPLFHAHGAAPVACPFCDAEDTELYALFGSQLSTSQYYCRNCRVAFEHFKWDRESQRE